MVLSPHDLQQLSQIAITAALAAGDIIANSSAKEIQVHHKDAGDTLASQLVTEVDHRCQAAILEILSPSLERYRLALLTEESDDDQSRLRQDYFWGIDPMDGTQSFVESRPGYSVSIALVALDGTPMLGVIYDPITNTLYSAIRGEGATRNGEPWHLPPIDSADPLTLVCDRHLIKRPDYAEIRAAFQGLAGELGLSGVTVLDSAGAVLSACWVAENGPALYFKRPKPQNGGGCPWDFAATSCLFGELGLVATDFVGDPLQLNPSGSLYMNHCGVMFSSTHEIAQRTIPLMDSFPLTYKW